MPTADTALLLIGYAAAINLAGWGAFAWDKLRARDGLWRIPERTLLTIAAIGGSPGAILALETACTPMAKGSTIAPSAKLT